jgi:hypothetical protein
VVSGITVFLVEIGCKKLIYSIMIKRYLNFINEADETGTEGIKSLNPSNYTEIKDEIKSMIEKTIDKSGGEYKTFIESFEKNPEDVKVEGFINDADIYEFYLKFRNDIDEILNNIKFFDESPVTSNAYGLYEYTIKGSEKAFMEVVKML